MTSASTPSWPPANGPTTPINPRESAVVKMYASTRINAPASLVFDLVRDTSRYSEWNSFIPRAEIRAQPEGEPGDSKMLVNGTKFTYYAAMDSSKPDSRRAVELKVNDVSTPEKPSSYISQAMLDSEPCYSSDLSKIYRITWTSEEALMTKALRAERFHEIMILGENECEVRTWECQSGVLGYVVNWMYSQTLMDKFSNWVLELKGLAERNV